MSTRSGQPVSQNSCKCQFLALSVTKLCDSGTVITHFQFRMTNDQRKITTGVIKKEKFIGGNLQLHHLLVSMSS